MTFRLLGFLVALGVAVASWMLTCGAWKLSEEVDRVAPLDPVTFARLTVVAVGTGDAHENPERRGPSIGIGVGDRVVLVDAGRASADGLRLAGIPVSQPRVVLLSSLLPGDTVGLDDLLFTGWIEGRAEPLTLVGPPGTAALAAGVEAALAGGLAALGGELGLPLEAARFEVVEIAEGWSTSLPASGGGAEAEGAGRDGAPAGGPEALRVRAAALPGGPTGAFAYRFEAGGRAAVVAGEGWAPDAVARLARGAQLLVHGAVFPMTGALADQLGIEGAEAERLRRETALQTSILEVGGLAARAGVETLVLVRLRPPPVYDVQLSGIVGDDFDGRLVIAADGDRVTP